MFPHQGQGISHGMHVNPSLPSNSVQGIPGMPASAMIPAGGPSSGFALQHGFVGNIPLTQVSSGPMNVQPNQNKQWQQPQQQASHQDAQPQHQKDLKHRDYLKQQQRLKAMPLSSSKGMSADALIGNLLDKKDTFTLRQSVKAQAKQAGDRVDQPGQISQMRPSVQPDPVMNRVTIGIENLPAWLIPSSSRLPSIYSHIWSLVGDPTSGGTLVDTNKILALLLTSGLPKEVLGFIWNLSTNGANVQLNQQQLYITLALVALAQMGCTFNNLSVLNFIPTPPIPSFNMSIPKGGADDKSKRPDASTKSAVPPPILSAPTMMVASSSVVTPPAFPPGQNQTEDDDFADEFTDFQSADTTCIPTSNLNDICTSLPATAVIQPSVAAKQVVNELNHSVVSKLGRSQGRAIGSRLANHHLGAPKNVNQKPRRASIEHEVCIQDDFGFNLEKTQSYHEDLKTQSKHLDSSENEDFSEFQVAAGLNVNVDELFPKCHLKSKSQEFMLKESAIRTESDDDEVTRPKEEELLAFDSPSLKPAVSEMKSISAPVEIPLVAPPPTAAAKELISIEEDKYSALRMIKLDTLSSSVPGLDDTSKSVDADDFGDFVSADDMFAEIAVRENTAPAKPTVFPSPNNVPAPAMQNVEFLVDDWATPVFQSSDPVQESSLFESQIMPSNPKSRYDDLSSAFSDVRISTESSDLSKIDTSTKWSFDFDSGKESSSLNLNSNLENNTDGNDDDFGDFVGPDPLQVDDLNRKSSSGFLGDPLWAENGSSKIVSDNKSVNSLELTGISLSRHGSLPSLDLNLFPASDDTGDKALSLQVSDWIRCLDSSCSLLQSAASTFTNITSHSVLMEVLVAVEGRNYLNNLLEVHRVTWRIQRSYQRSGHESNQIDTILGSILKVWSTLQTFYKLANIESAVEKGGSDEESGQPACGVCGSPASRGVLEYGGHVYHAPCANLWLNCVDRTLPAHSPLL